MENLISAIESLNVNEVKAILSQKSISLNHTKSPLEYLYNYELYSEDEVYSRPEKYKLAAKICNLLLDYGFTFDHKKNKPVYALFSFGFSTGNAHFIKKIAKQIIDINDNDRYRLSILGEAYEHCSLNMVKWFIKKGANEVGEHEILGLSGAIRTSNYKNKPLQGNKKFELAIKNKNIAHYSESVYSLLLFSAFEYLEYFIEKGEIYPNQIFKSPEYFHRKEISINDLILACHSPASISYFAQKGWVTPDYVNEEGRNLLMLAVVTETKNHNFSTQILECKNILSIIGLKRFDLDEKDNEGLTVWDLAKVNNTIEIMNVLKEEKQRQELEDIQLEQAKLNNQIKIIEKQKTVKI